MRGVWRRLLVSNRFAAAGRSRAAHAFGLPFQRRRSGSLLAITRVARRQRVLGERTACSAWHAMSMSCLSRGEYCAALCQLLAVLIGGALLCTGIAMRAHDAFYRARVAVGVLCSVTMLFAACEIYSAAAHAVLIRVDARGLFYRALALGSGLSSFRAWAFRLSRGLWAHAKPSFSGVVHGIVLGRSAAGARTGYGSAARLLRRPGGRGRLIPREGLRHWLTRDSWIGARSGSWTGAGGRAVASRRFVSHDRTAGWWFRQAIPRRCAARARRGEGR